MRNRPPVDEDELLERTDTIAGRTLREVAQALKWPVPPDLKRHKGWIGQLLEAALGADAASRPVPDFEHLAIELKTLPVDAAGRPRESTFVSSAPLDGSLAPNWRSSRVRKKLSAVLWIPVVGKGPPGDRLIGTGVLWRPSPAEDAALEADWTELTDLIKLGEYWQIDARRGRHLQIRPKAAHSDTMTWTIGESGDWVREGPRGFYLRASFTAAILGRTLRAG